MITWNVHPEIFTLGSLTPRWYGLLFVFGFLFGLSFMRKAAKNENKDPQLLDLLLVYVIVGTTLGARLGHCLFYEPSYYLRHPLEILMIWRGGLASHGGGLGVILSLYLFSRKYSSYPFLWLLDRAAIPVALAGSFIRIGNLMNSEIIGKPTDGSWGFIFTRVDNIPRHPTQIYESLAYLFVFIISYFAYKKWKDKRKEGFYFGLVVGLIYISRILIEFFKENQEIWEASLPLNMGQLLSIPYLLISAAFIFYSFHREKIEKNSIEEELQKRKKEKSDKNAKKKKRK